MKSEGGTRSTGFRLYFGCGFEGWVKCLTQKLARGQTKEAPYLVARRSA